jgi:putative endonuclease
LDLRNSVQLTPRIRYSRMEIRFFVYILASKRNGTLYVGVTNNLARRMSEHKTKLVPGFTRQYGVDLLVYFEAFDSILEARAREHSLKRWRRAWKINLIEKLNPDWRDLTDQLNS